jgi:ankyrin repeat protein
MHGHYHRVEELVDYHLPTSGSATCQQASTRAAATSQQEYLDVQDKEGKTALHYAAESTPLPRGWDSDYETQYDYVKVVEKLLAARCNPNVQDNEGRTALHYADDSEVVEALVTAGCGLDVQDKQGQTALHCAVVNVNLNVVRALLKAGCTPNVKNKEGKISLHLAAAVRYHAKEDAESEQEEEETETETEADRGACMHLVRMMHIVV